MVAHPSSLCVPGTPASRLLETEAVDQASQQKLGKLARSGDVGARNSLIVCNARLAYHVAKRCSYGRVRIEDAFSAALHGLVQAADRYDPSLGKFVDYAGFRMRGELQRLHLESSHAMRIPRSRMAKARKMARAMAKCGDGATEFELSAEAGCALADADRLKSLVAGDVSLDAPLTEGSSFSLLETLPETAEPGEIVAIREQLLVALKCLPKKHRKIIELYFGLDGSEPQNLTQISSDLGCTVERVRQIKVEALKMLRRRWKPTL